jgi:D-alanine-D-alanine ligase
MQDNYLLSGAGRRKYILRLGIAYDTQDMYNLGADSSLYCDFDDIETITTLKHILASIGYQTVMLGNTEHVAQLIQNGQFQCDLVFNLVEGVKSRNREGLLPALLEIYNIPYIGTDAFGLSLTLNKALTKMLAERLGILTPKFFTVAPDCPVESIRELLGAMSMPVIIKPNIEGNSSGISVEQTVAKAIEKISYTLEQYKTAILCEEFIFGQEITVPFIGNKPFDMIWGITGVDIQRNDEFWLTSEMKILGDYNNIILSLPKATEEAFQRISTKLFFEIGCRDFARFDYRLTKSGDIYFIEVNPLPSLFAGGSFDIVGEQYGYTFAETVGHIVEAACKRMSIPKIEILPRTNDDH